MTQGESGRCGQMMLSLLVLMVVAGCTVQRGKIYVKDGQRYGVTSQHTWRDRWWDYYERGTSYAAGEFWQEALDDFQSALAQRDQDQRRARTYGMHLIDYFPHRETGIIHYRRGRHPDAIRELETSLDAEATAKAKFYLNKARQAFLLQSKGDTAPPRIVLQDLRDGWLTNRSRIMVAGRVEDDTYVAAIAINGQAQFIELAEPQLRFTQEVALHRGANRIDIVADDLVGRQSRHQLTVYLDRHGPLLSLERIDMVGTSPHQHVRVRGFLVDDSRITRFVLAGRQVPLQPGAEWAFRLDIPIAKGTAVLPFEVEDAAGNVTRGDIDLVSGSNGASEIRKGGRMPSVLPRWAVHLPEPSAHSVASDLPSLQAVLLQSASLRDVQAPVIRLTGLTDREVVYEDTVYLEGQVTDASDLVAFSINGESLWRRQTRQLYFGHTIPLQLGENVLTLEAVDAAGNTTQFTVVVIRDVRPVRQMGMRLRVALLPFEKQGEASVLSQIVYDYLSNAFVQQQRFDVVERQRLDAILREHKLSQSNLSDPATAAKTGKVATADGILAGMVTETPQSLEVFARFVDVDSAVVLAAEDVYGEDLTPRTMQTLMAGLAWKFRRHFPMHEGFILETEGKRLTTDLAESHGIKRYMKLIVFRSGQTLKHPRTGRPLDKPDTVLGEAQIVSVTADLSEAVLLPSNEQGKVHESDRVITK